ncbi:Soluble lamin-associated protein of 75 kDa [Takifugu flavidus]|uniref:Soluble lamin-associated protein of 75 kDa n=1 Tax=Takifugu flavidus TaxID=433684 RepID=A0A5C6N5Q8_9TELE|nr:Soluble lamin-associated protein of 75 kDa [Takifugu flavidus]
MTSLVPDMMSMTQVQREEKGGGQVEDRIGRRGEERRGEERRGEERRGEERRGEERRGEETMTQELVPQQGGLVAKCSAPILPLETLGTTAPPIGRKVPLHEPGPAQGFFLLKGPTTGVTAALGSLTGMKFPVDLLADFSKAQLENLAQEYYMNTLLYSQHDSSEYLTLPDTTQVTISVSSTGFVPFYGQNEKNKILVLFSPSDLKSAIALYLLDRWWTVEDILKTADPARRGVLPVDTVGERIVLYILNRIIYRGKEMIAEELPFLCHGSMYKRFSTQTYQLPVMDSIFVRKCHRGKGSGLLMLKDFVLSFSEVSLGLKYPLSNSMYRVCEKYLCEYPEHADLLWEVESIGGPYQRTNIASKIQVMGLSGGNDSSENHQRIEHIEAGASREDQVSVQQETEMHDLQTEGMFHPEETVEDTSNTTPIAEEALSVKESHRNLGSRDTLEVSPANGEPRDKITQEEHISTHNSPAEDENVTSENEEVKEDSATLVVYEEVFEVHTEVETLKQGDQGQVLRKTTIFSTKTVESNYIQQKSDKETNENTLQTIDIVGELAVTDPEPEESQVLSDDILVMEEQLKDEELQNEELTGNEYEFVVKDAILHPDTAETVNKRGHLLTESLTLQEVQISDHMSDDETEEPPVIPRRGRRKVNPKSTKQRQHKEEGEHTHEAEPIAGRSLGRKEADKKAVDKQMEDQNQEETDQSMDRTPETSAQELLVVEDGRTPGAHESEEDAITSTKVRIEINKDDIKEMPPEMDSDYGNEETGAICGDNLDQPTSSVPDELQLTKDCEMPRLQQSRVILVDLKTGSDYVSLMVAGETIEVQCLASEREEVELTADEKMDKDPETALQPSTEEDNDDLEEVNGNKGKEDSSNENHEEEETFIETIYLRSGRKIIKLGHQEHQHDDIAAVSTCDEDHEKETITNDGITGEYPVEEKQSAEQASTQPEINDEMRLEDEAPIHLQPSIQVSMVKISTEVEVEENKTDDGEIAGIENGDKSVDQREEKPKAEVKVMDDGEVSEIKISAEVETQTEKETPVTVDVDEGLVTLSEDQENTADSTSPDTLQASNLEEPFRASEEKPHSEEMDPKESDLHRVTVVVVELRNSSQLLDEKTVTDSCIAEEQPVVEMEEQNMKDALREDGQTEAAPDVPVKASSVSKEAIATQNKQSAEDDEAEGVSGAEETPVLERRVLRSGRKTGNIRTQRKGRRSAATTPQGKSKRAQTKEESEEQERDETIPTLEELTEEPKTDLEDVPQKEPSKEQDVQEENDGVGVAQEEEEMQLHCEEADETSQDEPASIGTALRKAKRTAPATSTHKSKRFCMQRESEEETSAADREVEDNKTDDGKIAEIEHGDKSVDQGEEKPKAKVKVMGDPSEQAMEVAGSETCPNEQAEPSKEVSEIDISAEVEVEENKTDDSGIAEIENGDKSVDQGEEKLKDMDVVSAGTNSETRSNGEGENYLSETASAPMTVVEGDTDENEAPVVPTHICGSNGNTINASAGTIPLKCQIEENEEETRETHSGPDEPEPEQRLVIHAEEQVIEVPEGEEEELAEETTSMEKEIKIDGARDQIIGSESACLRGAESEKFNDEPPVEVLETGTEVYGTSRGMEAEITEIDVEPPTAAPEEDHLILFDEEAPTVTSKSQKSSTKRPKTTPKRTSRRRKKQGLQQYVAESGDDKTQEKPEDPGETSQPHEPSGFITAKDLEESDMEESVEGDIISVESEKDISSNSELNKDEDGKEFNLEVEDNLSDDDGELIVMEEKVLRRRTVPALIITPRSNSRCHRIKEKTPQLALKKKPIKRKGTETTPGRRSKRRSRV